jgi:hypothetical protein
MDKRRLFGNWGNVKMRDHLENRDVDGRIILKCFWIDPAEDRKMWRALVNAVMNPQVHTTRGVS